MINIISKLLLFFSIILFTNVICPNLPEVVILKNRVKINFRVDDDFSTMEKSLILKAFQKINSLSGCVNLKVNFENITLRDIFLWERDGRPTIYKSSNLLSWKSYMFYYISNSVNNLGIAIIKTGDIFVTVSSDNEDKFQNVISHEILHIIFSSGWHSKEEDSLMNATIGEKKQTFKFSEIYKLRQLCNKMEEPWIIYMPRWSKLFKAKQAMIL